MITSSRNSSRLALAAALAVFSQAAMALGLGNATVESYLNQPLQARIDLITRPEEDLSEVTARLASADDFALIGARREAISVPLRFSIQQDERGVAVLVTSNLPVKDPIVRLIVEVAWPGGRMLREYTLFLDPPTVEAAAPPPLTDQRSDSPARPATPTEPDTATAVQPSPAPATPSPLPGAAAAVPEEGEYGPVQSGETLWRIASDWSRGTGLNLNQVMLAIQRNNSHAFIDNNINLLMRGAILRMPRVEDVMAVSVEAALAEVSEQNAAFDQGSARATSAPAVETPLVDEASTAPDFEVAESEELPDSKLEIVPPAESAEADSASGAADAGEGAQAATSIALLREELARAEEALIGEQQENQYLQDRIAELESLLAAAGEGTVEDSDLAAMESRLREERLAERELAEADGEDAAAEAPEPAAATPAQPTPQVTSAPAAGTERPWYRSIIVWLIIVVAAGAALAGWIMSRRRSGEPLLSALGRSEDETVRGIKDEAEEILNVLRPEDAQSEPAGASEEGPEEGEEYGDAETAQPQDRKTAAQHEADEAEVLDEESEDPEVRLDLARAYIAMGDREAARVILDEVIQQGDEAQQAEARSMLDEL